MSVQPGENTLVVSVLDAQNGPKGKQNVNAFDNPRFIFYTATSGIWQTVWLETVPANRVSGLKITPDIDQGTVSVVLSTQTPVWRASRSRMARPLSLKLKAKPVQR